MSENRKPKQKLEARVEKERGIAKIEWEDYMRQILRKGKSPRNEENAKG